MLGNLFSKVPAESMHAYEHKSLFKKVKIWDVTKATFPHLYKSMTYRFVYNTILH